MLPGWIVLPGWVVLPPGFALLSGGFPGRGFSLL
jgi:hypothetical protein